MRRLSAFSLLMLTACASPGPPSSRAPIDESRVRLGTSITGEQPRRLCGAECIRAHAMGCKDERAWRVDLAPQVGGWQLTVAATGLLRFTVGNRALFTVDSRLALGCLPQCGERAGTCLPYPFGFSLATLAGLSNCDRTVVDGAAWNGRKTRRVVLACDEGSVTIIVVPELAPLRDALVLAGAIPADDVSRTLDGLAIEAELGPRRFEFVTRVTPGGCADLEIPAGWSIRDQPKDVTSADAAWRDATQVIQAQVAGDERPRPATVEGAFNSMDGEFCRAFHTLAPPTSAR